MKLLVTGGTGFIGRRTVSAALEAGHDVRVLVRPQSEVDHIWQTDGLRVETVLGDLRSGRHLDAACKDVDAVVHLAAAKQGSFYDQFESTVGATEKLLAAMERAGVRRLVLLSSFTVYSAASDRTDVDETYPLEPQPKSRDAYTWTKLLQESLVTQAAQRNDALSATILRAGVVYGPDNLWSARLGLQLRSDLWLCAGPTTLLPLVYVDHCAAAVVAAAHTDLGRGVHVYNVVDDDPPTKHAYVAALAERQPERVRVVWLPWRVVSALGALAAAANRLLFGGEARLPGLLKPAVIASRMRPKRYPNDRLRDGLGMTSPTPLSRALDEAMQ